MFLLALEVMAMGVLGEHAAFTADERRLIEGPLARMLVRVGADRSAQLMQWLDPISLCVGLGMWGRRVFVPPSAAEVGAPLPADPAAVGGADYTPPAYTAPTNGASGKVPSSVYGVLGGEQ